MMRLKRLEVRRQLNGLGRWLLKVKESLRIWDKISRLKRLAGLESHGIHPRNRSFEIAYAREAGSRGSVSIRRCDSSAPGVWRGWGRRLLCRRGWDTRPGLGVGSARAAARDPASSDNDYSSSVATGMDSRRSSQRRELPTGRRHEPEG